MEYCSAIKKKKILLFAKVWMDLENTMLSEIGQLEEDKYHMISFICGIYWTNWTNKENGDRLVDGEQDDCWRGVLSQGVEGLSKKEKGLMVMEKIEDYIKKQ